MTTLSLPLPAASHPTTQTSEVGLLRLYALRIVYAMVAVLMGGQIWPLVLHHRVWSDPMHGVAVSMLAAVTALCLLGLRYPLKMLPLLFVEMVWKVIWLLSIAYPLWMSGHLDAATSETAFACLMGVIFPLVIPWRYVWRHCICAPADRWR